MPSGLIEGKCAVPQLFGSLQKNCSVVQNFPDFIRTLREDSVMHWSSYNPTAVESQYSELDSEIAVLQLVTDKYTIAVVSQQSCPVHARTFNGSVELLALLRVPI